MAKCGLQPTHTPLASPCVGSSGGLYYVQLCKFEAHAVRLRPWAPEMRHDMSMRVIQYLRYDTAA